MKYPSHRRSRRAVSFAFGVAAALVSVSAVSAQSTIKWLHLETNPEYLALWEQIAEEYEAENPEVDVQLQFLENEAFKAKLPTLLQSADAPSMFYTWGGGVLEAQSETGAIRDVTAALDANDGEWRKSINPASVDAMTFNDKVWAVPFKSGVLPFWYNKEMFEEAGVDAESIETWDDFLGAVQKLKDAGITPIAAGGGEKWPIHFYWSYLAMREAGRDGFMAAKAGEDGGFTNEAFVEAGQHLADLGALEPFQDGWLGATWPDAQAAFADGRAAILLGFEGNGTAASQARAGTDGKGLDQDNIGRFTFPVVEGAPGLATDAIGGINGWVITTVAPPETEDFIKFLTNVENSRRQAEVQNMIPTTIGAEDGVRDEKLALSAEQMAGTTWHQNFLDQDLGPNVGRVVNDMSVAIAAGEISPADAAQQIQDAMDMEM